MTKGWGPLGWATLHSISAVYPDTPSDLELEMFSRWLVSFTGTILCPSCLQHFTDMVSEYDHRFPNWRKSKRGVVEFVFRAHNTVNARNRGKVYTFKESLDELAVFLPEDRAVAVRLEYLNYIRNDWMKNMTLSGISTAPKLRELNLIEENYWSQRTFKWTDLAVFSDINVSPLVNQVSSLGSGNSLIPKIVMPSGGFTLRNIGRIGPLLNLRS